MAKRPVFIPCSKGRQAFAEVFVEFKWHPGMSATQKQKNVFELHKAAAASRGLSRILEVSTKSDRLIGRRLSAFHQKVECAGGVYPLECVYQSSKVFEHGGPFVDLLYVTPKEAKRDERLKVYGDLVEFRLNGQSYPLLPRTAFYDWLYIRSLYPERDWLKRLHKLDGFTDIEFNPGKSINCQARSCAIFVSLQKNGSIDKAVSSFDAFVGLQERAEVRTETLL